MEINSCIFTKIKKILIKIDCKVLIGVIFFFIILIIECKVCKFLYFLIERKI